MSAVKAKLEGPGAERAKAFLKRREEERSANRANCEPRTPEEGAGEEKNGVRLLCASEIPPESISWLWPGWLASGKLHILGGIAGTGKTTIALSLAATITTGGVFPDGSRCQHPGKVLIWSGEDAPADTLVPRLSIARADLDKVFFVEEIVKDGERRAFDPAEDLGALTEQLERLGDVRLLIVDSIVSAVTGDSHKNGEVRRALQPFVDMGARFGCAVLGITHFSKGTKGGNPLERVTGSVAFGALARLVLVASKNEKATEGESACIFARAKSNIGKDFGGFGYDLEQDELSEHSEVSASRVRWGAALEGTAAEILDKAEALPEGRGGSAKAECMAWLRDYLGFEQIDSKEVKEMAKAEGYSDKVLRDAREALDVGIQREGRRRDRVAYWSLPTGGKSINALKSINAHSPG